MNSLTIKTAARSSLLSRKQFEEVQDLLKQKDSKIVLQPEWVVTYGDLDRTTSLRTLDKTDFFTREVDAFVLSGKCHIAIHSAKDLPACLPAKIEIIALTKGVDPSDALVLPPHTTLDSLPKDSLIATSSERREQAVSTLRSDFQFCDLRGTIQERLALLENGKVQGVVVAEAALIRLGLTHLNRIILPGSTTPFQGQLAITALKQNKWIREIFAFLDVRNGL